MEKNREFSHTLLMLLACLLPLFVLFVLALSGVAVNGLFFLLFFITCCLAVLFFAYQALQVENKIGTMLPCNAIVQELAEDQVEVSAIDPIASMQAVDNPKLEGVAKKVQEKLHRVIDNV